MAGVLGIDRLGFFRLGAEDGMAATTLLDLRAAIRAEVEALTPQVTRLSGQQWHWVEDADDVGYGLRTFTVEIGGDLRLPDDRGVFTSEIQSYRTELRIVVGYGGLQDIEFHANKLADGRQIYRGLASSLVTGMELIIPNGFSELDRSEKRKRVGAHVFEIDFLLSNNPQA